MSHLRVELAQVGSESRVFYVASDGTETDVSSIVRKIEIHSEAGGATHVSLGLVKISGDVEGELVQLLADGVGS